MSAFKISIQQFDTPYEVAPEVLVLEGSSGHEQVQNWHSFDAFIYDCIVKAKSVLKESDVQQPLIWLLPALPFQTDHKTLFINSLQQRYGIAVEQMIFEGANAMHSAIALAKEQNFSAFDVVAIDGVFKASKHNGFEYLGIAACKACGEFTQVGWALQSTSMCSSVDIAKHQPIHAELERILSLNEQKIDLVFAPGNGLESDDWVSYLPVLSKKINEQTMFQLPNYKLGKMGAIEGVVNLASLTNSALYAERFGQALIISQEYNKYQAVASYLWISKEMCN